jgi:hypothetical protein
MSAPASASGSLEWRISSTCDGGQCVGVARKGQMILIRNTNAPQGMASEFTVDEWRDFLAGAKLGDFDGIA